MGAIGSIEAADPDRQRIARRFRRALAHGLEDAEPFSRVLPTAPARFPAGAALVTGRFLEVNDGSEALRFLVGAGAGSTTLRARFEMSDPTGRVLASFEEDARSYDGTGYAALEPRRSGRSRRRFRRGNRRGDRPLEPRRRAGSVHLVGPQHGKSRPRRAE